MLHFALTAWFIGSHRTTFLTILLLVIMEINDILMSLWDKDHHIECRQPFQHISMT